MHPAPNPQIEPPVRQAEEARATWGALAEPEPQDGEIELVTVTPGISEVDVTTYANISDAAEHVLNTALEEIASIELAGLPGAQSPVRARLIRRIGRELFYEIQVDLGNGWIERRVVRADKAYYYTKVTYLYLDDVAIPVELRAVYSNGLLYYEAYIRPSMALGMSHDLEVLLRREGGV
jgi:hypothetical protein